MLVHNSIRLELVRQLADAARAVRVGDPADPAAEMGPLISSAARDRVERYVAAATGSVAPVVQGTTEAGTTGS